MEFYIPFFAKSLLASISAVFINFYIFYSKDKTTISNNQIAVAVLFAPAIYIITLSISDNLALSLGMIGALSIVRFRNPVKDPLEIIVYFLFITIVITLAVNHIYYAVLMFFILSFPIFLFIINKIKKKFFIKNIREGEEIESYNCSIVIEANKLIDKLPADILKKVTSLEEEVKSENSTYKINLSVKNIKENESIKNEFNKCGKIISSSIFRFF